MTKNKLEQFVIIEISPQIISTLGYFKKNEILTFTLSDNESGKLEEKGIIYG